MDKCKILVPQGCRSDAPLSEPIIKRLRESGMFEVIVPQLIPESFGNSYFTTKTYCLEHEPDIMLATGDRIEMTAATAACFHTNIPIVHYGAGIVNYPLSTWDDVNRHCITLWSDIALCEDNESAQRVLDLWTLLQKITKWSSGVNEPIKVIKGCPIHIVGYTHLEDIEIDESLVPKSSQGVHDIIEDYDLILINPETIETSEFQKELQELREELKGSKYIHIGANPDPSEYIQFPHYENLPRAQFLGLLKNCKRFISNSSCTYYEAPLWLKPEQIIIIGDRNKNRSTKFNPEQGTSDKIVKIIKEWWINKNV